MTIIEKNIREAQFLEECRPIPMKQLYPGDTSNIKYIITSDADMLTVEAKYGDILAPFRPYLIISSAVREYLDESRRVLRNQEARKRRHILPCDIGDLEPVEDNEYNPSLTILAHEQNGQLYAALRLIPETQCRKIVLYYFENKSSVEIARILGTSHQSVLRGINAGLENLRKIMS